MLKLTVGLVFGVLASFAAVSVHLPEQVIYTTVIERNILVPVVQPSFRQLRQVTYLISLVNESGYVLGGGSGVAISSNRMLTAGHVAEAIKDQPGLKLMMGEVELKVVKVNTTRDIAVLEGDFPNWIHFALTPAEIDSEVIAVGFPMGEGPVITEGRVMKYGTKIGSDGKYMLVTSPIAPGNSGGGLFQWRGDLKDGHWVLVGITVAVMGGCNMFGCNPVHHLTLAADLDAMKSVLE